MQKTNFVTTFYFSFSMSEVFFLPWDFIKTNKQKLSGKKQQRARNTNMENLDGHKIHLIEDVPLQQYQG
jgi:hypothetical protein